MLKQFFLLSTLLICMPLFAKEEVKSLPLDPAYQGTHGMVLMSKSSTIFASHLPLYHKPHDAQIIYKLKVSEVALVQLVRDNPLVTIKPEKFNLQRLIRGETLTLKADVYLGHFERGGELVYRQMALDFDKQLYVKKLDDIPPSMRKQQYEFVSYNSKNDRLVVHTIQQPPSFDHILHIDQQAGCRSTFVTSSAVPTENELLMKFMNCGTIKPMYYETQDFRDTDH